MTFEQIENWRSLKENRHECYADGMPIYKIHLTERDPLCANFANWIWSEGSDYIITIKYCPYCGIKLNP